MYKTIDDILCVPLVVEPQDLVPIITSPTHLQDLNSVVASKFKRGFIICNDLTTVGFYFKADNSSNPQVHHYKVDGAKLLQLFNNKKKSTKIETFIQRRG